MNYFNEPKANGPLTYVPHQDKPLSEYGLVIKEAIKQAQRELCRDDYDYASRMCDPTNREIAELEKVFDRCRYLEPEITIEDMAFEACQLVDSTHAYSWESLAGDFRAADDIVGLYHCSNYRDFVL